MTSYEVLVNRKPHSVKILSRNGYNFLVKINGKTVTAEIQNASRGRTPIITINGESFQAKIENVQRNILQVRIGRKTFEVQRKISLPRRTGFKPEPEAIITKRAAARPTISTSEEGAVTAPIAGRIVLLKANVGQKVEKGDRICVLEAMKMENEITAPRRGIIKEIKISNGATVDRGDVLLVIG